MEIESILAQLRVALPHAVVTLCRNPGPSGQHSLLIDPANLIEVHRYLRDALDFDYLSNVTGVDWLDPAKANALAIPDDSYVPPAEGGFLEVLYHLYSTRHREGPLVLRARTIDRETQIAIPSVVSVFRSAEFQEREIFDLYGIGFTNHPDLRRILMWDEFVDFPMRKDYVAPDDYEYEPTPHDARSSALALVARLGVRG
jgi:NADH-quinone oxidoreductase subunit C